MYPFCNIIDIYLLNLYFLLPSQWHGSQGEFTAWVRVEHCWAGANDTRGSAAAAQWWVSCSLRGQHSMTLRHRLQPCRRAQGYYLSGGKCSPESWWRRRKQNKCKHSSNSSRNKERSSNENSNTHSCNNNKNNSNQHYKSNAAFTLNRNNNTEHSLNIDTNTHTHAYIIISKMKKTLRKWINLR